MKLGWSIPLPGPFRVSGTIGPPRLGGGGRPPSRKPEPLEGWENWAMGALYSVLIPSFLALGAFVLTGGSTHAAGWGALAGIALVAVVWVPIGLVAGLVTLIVYRTSQVMRSIPWADRGGIATAELVLRAFGADHE